MLSLFYWVVDVRGWRAWSAPLAVVGANAIAVYLLAAFVDFEAIASLLVGPAVPRRLHPALLPAAALGALWMVAWLLWRARIFLRV